jgi:hypothetical protein
MNAITLELKAELINKKIKTAMNSNSLVECKLMLMAIEVEIELLKAMIRDL